MGWFVFCWKKAFDWSGRARRREFWFFVLFDRVFILLLTAIAYMSIRDWTVAEDGVRLPNGFPALWASLALLGYWIASFFPFFAVTARRFHDLGRGAGWVLAVMVAQILAVIGNVVQILQVVAAFNAKSGVTQVPDNLFLQTSVGLWIFLAVFVFLRAGTPGANRFGPSPK